ncbi:putative coatomer subunit gamma [Venturia nashicola]|uniref:Alpha N-terminal protein methyltransferase 1 n=1 Tax=Venturia nashicola TaxID=86259 RepID=A0A4Z1NBU2_9PEZI|nr:putative coatomer subunit gamma [Venturia nashicola]TLD14753.1 putative coatomer subunit gamma [Venturia nashicola]
MSTKDMPTDPHEPADSAIDHKAALEYWSSVTADNNGVLGGYPQVSRIDLQSSSNFLSKLRRRSTHHAPGKRLSRAVDCGAGIGRITKGVLWKVAEVVDIVEPVVKLTRVITEGEEFEEVRREGRVGVVYNVGLEEWIPGFEYDLIWNQWCLGQLTDVQLFEYLERTKEFVREGGWIVVKENMSTDALGNDVFDETDSSVTRSDGKFRALFERAGLKIVATEVQRGMPKELFPVRIYAMQVK